MTCCFSIKHLLLFLLVFGEDLSAWGLEGHRVINLHGARSLPLSMLRFRDVEYYFADHASDVDRRKIREEEETYRQFIELERYPEFYNRTMPVTMLELQKKYGEEYVHANGYLPYLILEMYDSLQKCIKRKDWKSTLTAATDLGHYIGDLTMPLNTTMNYDGQLTKNNGVKWRFEIELMNRYYIQLNFRRIEARKFDYPATDPTNLVFALLAKSHSRVGLIMRADTASFRAAKRNYNSTYYSTLWKNVSASTNELMQDGADLFTHLLYNAWLNSGGTKVVWPDEERAFKGKSESEPKHLEPNFPNPFNPKTTIKYTLKEVYFIKLSVFNLFGQELDVLFEGRQGAGRYEFVFNGEHLPGGVYFVRLQLNNQAETRKMILAK